MPNNKLTDSEIIKALGRMSCKTLDDCELINAALDLINRLQKENKDLKTQFRYLDIECERLETENERLKESNRLLINNPVLAWQDDLENEIKAEAYKKCIEKVKAIAIKKTFVYVADASIQEQETGWLEIKEEALNELSKELVGE